MISVINKY